MKQGSTMAELLIMVGLLSIIIGIIVGADFFKQTKKAEDARRKTDLIALKKALEEYVSDKRQYPSVSSMTYAYMNDTSMAGKLCGDRKTDNPLRPYLDRIPCHPRSPVEDYVYFITDGGQAFVIYTTLNRSFYLTDPDPNIADAGCSGGCSYFLDESRPGETYSDNVYDFIVAPDGYSLPACAPANYWACYLNVVNPCRICPNGSCEEGHTSEYFCNPEWCLLKCQ